MSAVNLEERIRKRKFSFAIKRVVDVVASVLGLIFLCPFFLYAAYRIKKDSPGPVFFRQERVGKNGVPFKIYKFRTMVQDAEALGKQITVGRDKRITPFGEFLRAYKLDEFPQLINVLKGEMSLVGPRPEVPRYVALYSEEERKVLLVRPGITEEASVIFRNESELLSVAEDPEKYYIEEIMPRKLKLNLEYIEEFSLLKDLSILWRTFVKVF